nr:immunoglobulin heavy chain junction region [Mus musculus]
SSLTSEDSAVYFCT